jgi:prepilin-type N-terminal cleavage/methylation domain-containing protein
MVQEKNVPAFTLVELIVVMAIIAVLVGLSITTVQRSTRDTTRLSSLDAINLEVEAYNGSYGSYPTASQLAIDAAGTTLTITPVSGTAVTVTVAKAPKGFLNTSVATSVTSQTTTNYCYSSAGSTYSLGVKLESGKTQYFGTATACTAY